MQQRNFWIFLLVSMTILVGWTWLTIQFGPEPKKEEEKQAKKEEQKAPPEPKKQPEPEPKKQPPEESPKKPKEPPRPAEVKTTVLGGGDFYVQAVLTSRGAGVQKLTLTRFQAANWEGLPEVLPSGKPAPLDLIPEDPYKPSFLMFHYPEPVAGDADNARPDYSLADRVWTLEDEQKGKDRHTIVFTTPGPPGYEYLTLRKTYTLETRSYHIGLKIEIQDNEQDKGKRKPFRYQLAGAHNLPIEGGWYTPTFRNAMIGMVDSRKSLWRWFEDAAKISFRGGGDRIPQSAPGPNEFIQYAAVTTQYFASAIVVSHEQEGGMKMSDVLAYARPTLESTEKVCFVDRWDAGKAEIRLNDEQRTQRTVQLLPKARKDLEDLSLRPGDQVVVNYYETYQDGVRTFVAIQFRHGSVVKPFLDDITVRVVSNEIKLDAGAKEAHQFLLYHGPVKVSQLNLFTGESAVDPDLVERYASTLHLATLTDYPSVTWLSWWSDLLIACTKVMHWLLNLLYWLVPIEGITIILLTVVVRSLMFPISRKQALTTMRMQELAPEMKKIQDKYKNDPQARNQAVMELYRKYNVNPFSGCLPLFLQLPVFLGLYYALQESIRFRLASFLWIDNLAAPDMLIYWGQGFPWLTDPDSQGGILYLGPYFNLLPILAVVIMLVHQKMVMPPPQDEQQEMQQKMMTYMMIFIGIMFYKVAAGLCLYFIATTLWGMLERKFLPKKKLGGGTVETGVPAKPGPSGDGGPRLTPAQRRKARAKGGKKPEEPDTAFKKVRDWWEEVLKQAKKK